MTAFEIITISLFVALVATIMVYLIFDWTRNK